MAQLIAFCGLDCGACEAYLATQAGDLAAQERIAAKWREEFHSPEIGIAEVTCDGCTGAGRHGGYCGMCGVRACAVGRGVVHCAACDDYGCETLTAFFAIAPQAQANLETLRQSR